MGSKKLSRFFDAQEQVYSKALSEIKVGKKSSHWMWFIFPQLKGLGYSETANFYGIDDLDEATAYLADPVLGKRLIEITSAVLTLEGKSANQIFGSPDDMKFHSSMTLFANVPNTDPIFQKALLKYFKGVSDNLTIKLLQNLSSK